MPSASTGVIVIVFALTVGVSVSRPMDCPARVKLLVTIGLAEVSRVYVAPLLMAPIVLKLKLLLPVRVRLPTVIASLTPGAPMSNATVPVNDDWFRGTHTICVYGTEVRITPPTELIWSKVFIQDRYRYDGADIAHVILKKHEEIDWKRLLPASYAAGVRGYYVEQEAPYDKPRLDSVRISAEYLGKLVA